MRVGFRRLLAATAIVREFEALAKEQQGEHPQKSDIPILKALNSEVDQLYASLTTIAKESRTNLLGQLLRSEELVGKIDDKTRLLWLRVLDASGSSRTTRNLFTGTKLYYQGGAIVTYMLFDCEGKIELGRTLYSSSRFIRWKDIPSEGMEFYDNGKK